MSAVVTPSVTASWPCYVRGESDDVTAPTCFCGWIRPGKARECVFVTLLRDFSRNTPITRARVKLGLNRLPNIPDYLGGVLGRNSRNNVTRQAA